MQITAIKYQNNLQNKGLMIKSIAASPVMPQNNTISNMYYLPPSMMSFKGIMLETRVVQKVVGKEGFGLNLYTADKNFIDLLNLKNIEPLDITKATDEEITARRFSLALRESYAEGSEHGTSWVQRYNPENRKAPLAVSHVLNRKNAKKLFAENLKFLYDDRCGKSLDIPITDKNGKLFLDAVVFDTETTGTNVKKDKIVQIATVRMKNGKVVESEDGTFNQLINPEMPIPKEASDVNGITDEMVENAPTIDTVLGKFLGKHMNKQNGIIVVYNSKFDIPLLNRLIREYNISASTDLKEKQLAKTLDPFILIQRIHPFLGAKKKLSQQYEWLFNKPMENAHDALADVKGTLDVLKYCLYYLSEHRKDKTVPLTLREVLIFQNGGHGVENIEIPLHLTRNFNASFDFSKSYRAEPLDVTNYFKGYKLTQKNITEMREEIGDRNFQKLLNNDVLDELVGTNYKGHTLNPAETERVPDSKKFKSLSYTMLETFKKVLGFAKLEGYNGKTKEEIEDLIIEKSKHYIKEDIKEIWIKNVDPKDIPLGNDLPDDTIARMVMKESQELQAS